MNREARLYFREKRQGIKRYLTNNFRRMHGEKMCRANTLYRVAKRSQYHRKVPGGSEG